MAKHTAGALRASKAIYEECDRLIEYMPPARFEEIIDQETGLADLLATAKAYVEAFKEPTTELLSIKGLEAAISRVEGGE